MASLALLAFQVLLEQLGRLVLPGRLVQLVLLEQPELVQLVRTEW